MKPAGRILGGAGGLAAVLALSLVTGTAQAGDKAWTQDRVSQGLQALGRAVPVSYAPGSQPPAIPPSARITGVYASRDYDSAAHIFTQVCWGSEQGPCVPLEGRSIQTHAFDGRAARGPLLLVHRVEGWGGGHPPVFVRGTVTVWFTLGLY